MKKVKEFAKYFAAPLVALVAPILVSAQISAPPVSAPTSYTNVNQITSQSGIICVIIDWVFWLLIVATIIFVLVAAFKYLTAGGDPEKVQKAGATLLYAVVAIVVALLAKGLPLLISSFIGGGLQGVGC